MSARPSVHTLPATAPIEEILGILHEDGVIVLSDFVSRQISMSRDIVSVLIAYL